MLLTAQHTRSGAPTTKQILHDWTWDWQGKALHEMLVLSGVDEAVVEVQSGMYITSLR